MKIEFLSDYKSTRKGVYDFPDFTVLTGENGSGKSNFLERIRYGDNVKIDGVPCTSLNIDIRRHNSFSSVLNEDYHTHSNSYSQEDRLHQTYKEYKSGKIKQLSEYDEKTIKNIAKANNKDFNGLVKDDFKNRFFPWYNSQTSLFGFNFYEHIAGYLGHQERNKFSHFLNKEYGEDNILYPPEEFIAKYGKPPWEIMNSLLEEADLNYRVVIPPKVRNQRVEPLIIDRVLGKELRLESMSSGEKMILALISFLYNLEKSEECPDIFLFDEPDALLHPFYSKKFIEILKLNIVDRLNKKVILVTHSPSTVAIVPKESLYLCTKEGFKIEKVSKDKALNNLTANINSLSILHENRRQVFVEDKDDAKIFEFIENKIAKHLHPEISITFIPASLSKVGGCTAVKKVVKALNDAGNRLVFGLIDWDGDNNPSDKSNVLVFGHNRRYSIENYLLDPVLIAAYLLREKIIKREDLGLTESQSYFDFKLLSSEQLQIVVDFILKKAEERKPAEHNEALLDVHYLNDKKVVIPEWFLKIRGHELEDFFLNKFRRLRGGKVKLSLRVLEHIVDIMPELIPIDFKDIFMKIQEG